MVVMLVMVVSYLEEGDHTVVSSATCVSVSLDPGGTIKSAELESGRPFIFCIYCVVEMNSNLSGLC